MITGLIPHRYAKALYKVALDKGDTRQIYELALCVVKSFRENPDLQKVLSNPFVKASDKEKLIIAAAGDKADDTFSRFARLVLAHHREDLVYLMMLAYRDIYRTENNISRVTLTTAVKLPDVETDKLKKLVANAFKGRTLEYETKVNPDIIGGFVIDVDSVRMDSSLSSELEQLRLNLIRSN